MLRTIATTVLTFSLSIGAAGAAEKTVQVLHDHKHHVEMAAKGSGELVEVNQITNNAAFTPLEMFQFKPDYVELEPGDTIRFLNSTSNHTVKSIKSMMPEGAEPFEISHEPVAKVKFDKEGVYGIRCKVHGRHGMVMLVKVGSNLTNLDAAKSVKHGGFIKKKFESLFKHIK